MKLKPKHCEQCGKIFYAERSSTRFCSRTCQRLSAYMRRKEIEGYCDRPLKDENDPRKREILEQMAKLPSKKTIVNEYEIVAVHCGSGMYYTYRKNVREDGIQ